MQYIIQFYINFKIQCENLFYLYNKKMYCRGGQVKVDVIFGVGLGVIWLDDVECCGNEIFLLECFSRFWG